MHPQTEEEFKKQRDTLMHFVESCANSDNSHSVFKTITADIENSDLSDTTRFDRYRDWLLSVVFLNTTNPYYYCACVTAMISTYRFGKYNVPNTSIAICRFLMENPNCDDQGLRNFYFQTLKSRHDDWLLGDTTIPEDTTVPSLEEIGLGALLKHNDVVSGSLPPTYLTSFTSSPNPFKNETRLHFHLNRTLHVSIQISDLLGKVLWETKGRTYEDGDHDIGINGKSLPDGTLYARISTGFGEVKTVKLIKTSE